MNWSRSRTDRGAERFSTNITVKIDFHEIQLNLVESKFYIYFKQRAKVANLDHIGLQRFNPNKSNRK